MLNQLILKNNEMKICITTVHDKIALITYVNHQEQCGLVAAKGKVLDIMYNNKPLTIDVNQFDIDKLNEICTFNIINHMKQNQFEFKSFDPVLVRTTDGVWKVDFFSHINTNEYGSSYCCTTGNWEECIPYNENTAHLVGTNKPYEAPEPKVWKVTCHKDNAVLHFTNDELKYFIENAIINNKDIQWFTVTYDENNN